MQVAPRAEALISQAEASPSAADWQGYDEKWLRTLLIALPFAVLAFVLGILLDGPSNQIDPLDFWAYPLMAVGLALLEIVLLLRGPLRFVVLTVISSAGLFFLVKLTFILFHSLTDPSTRAEAEMTETFYWMPVVYLLSFLIPRVRGGRLITLLFTGLIGLVSAAYVVPNLLAGQHWGVIYALAEMNLADIVFLFMAFTFIGYQEGYTRTRTKAEVMERFAYTDLLTELPNRLMLQLELEEALTEEAQKGGGVALIVVDLDGFKVINETLGHQVGDMLLKQVAQRLCHVTRREDFVARLSSDEFVVVVRDTDRRLAQFAAQKLQASLMAPFVVHSQLLSVTASLGVSLCPEDAQDPATLLRHATSAMHRVKRSGKNGVQTYSEGSDEAIERQLELERDLKGALTQGQFVLHYQPLVDLKTGRLVKAEALLRWQHPQWGMVSPAEFIPLAEESGLIVSIGAWVLKEACSQAKAWQRTALAEIKVAVNVSPLQLSQPDFFNVVTTALKTSGLAPEHLELELTESAVMREVESVSRTLRQLRHMGVSIAIDDFGTGYSSLAYLRDLPIDIVKIDRSFVRDLGSPRGAPQFALALVQAIVSLSSYLDLEVVAEGIENREQCVLLEQMGCRVGQGYYFAKPMRPGDVEHMLRAEAARPPGRTVYTN
jgi:diguanylate cyclase (GGDEF)-like protein